MNPTSLLSPSACMLINPDETATSGNFGNNSAANQPSSSYFNNKTQDFQNNSNDQIAANGKNSDYDNKASDLRASNVTIRRGDQRSAGPSTSSSNSSNLNQPQQTQNPEVTSSTSLVSLTNQTGSNLKNVLTNLINNASEIEIEILDENEHVPSLAGKFSIL